MDLNLSGRRALVTGASTGLGKSTALALAQEGAEVAIASRSQEKLAAAKLEIPRKVRELIAPAIANRLQRDQIDLALLVPA